MQLFEQYEASILFMQKPFDLDEFVTKVQSLL
jgi:hypothetical protein